MAAGRIRIKGGGGYRGTSLIRDSAPLGLYSRTMPRALWWPQGIGLFLMCEVTLYRIVSVELALRKGCERGTEVPRS